MELNTSIKNIKVMWRKKRELFSRGREEREAKGGVGSGENMELEQKEGVECNRGSGRSGMARMRALMARGTDGRGGPRAGGSREAALG